MPIAFSSGTPTTVHRSRCPTPRRARAGGLRGGAQLDADGRLGNPLTGVAASFTSEAVAVLADDRGVRLSTATSLAT